MFPGALTVLSRDYSTPPQLSESLFKELLEKGGTSQLLNPRAFNTLRQTSLGF